MNKKLIVLSSIVIMVLAFGVGSYLFKQKEVKEATKIIEKVTAKASGDSAPFVRDHSHSKGSPDAKVTIVEFLDPACETCAAFYPFIKRMMDKFPGQIKVVVRYAPFHHGADFSVKVLEAAAKQNLYWETLEILFKTQHQWTSHHQVKPELIWPILQKTKLDLNRLKADLESPEFLQIIGQDMADAKTLGVKRTPGFFVNGKPLVHFGYGPLSDLITSEIKSKY